MRTTIITLTAVASLFAFSSVRSSADNTAYICNNKKTEVYHVNQNCPALKRCTHEVVKTTVSAARGQGLRLCGYED